LVGEVVDGCSTTGVVVVAPVLEASDVPAGKARAAVPVIVIVCVRHGWACYQRTRANWLAGFAIQSRANWLVAWLNFVGWGRVYQYLGCECDEE